MTNTNGTKTKTTKSRKQGSKAAAKRDEEILHYKRLLEDNESRLTAKTNAKGEPLTPTQISTLQEVIAKQRARLDELMG